jgi:HEAT repeat protein
METMMKKSASSQSMQRRARLAVMPLVLFVLTGCLTSARADYSFPTPQEILQNAGVALTPEALVKALGHSSGYVRRSAAWMLGEQHATGAIPALERVLGDDFANARLAAAGSLLMMQDRAGAAVLEQGLKSERIDVVAEAALQFARASDTRGVDELAARLRDSKSENVRAVAADTLGSLAKMVAAARDRIRTELTTALVSDTSAAVRLAAASRLREDHSAEVHAAFAKAAVTEQDSVLRGIVEDYLTRGPADDRKKQR